MLTRMWMRVGEKLGLSVGRSGQDLPPPPPLGLGKTATY